MCPCFNTFQLLLVPKWNQFPYPILEKLMCSHTMQRLKCLPCSHLMSWRYPLKEGTMELDYTKMFTLQVPQVWWQNEAMLLSCLLPTLSYPVLCLCHGCIQPLLDRGLSGKESKTFLKILLKKWQRNPLQIKGSNHMQKSKHENCWHITYISTGPCNS